MTNEEISQLSILEIANNGWRLALENPIHALLVIIPIMIVFWLAYKYIEAHSIRELLVNKSAVIEARKRLGIKEK